MFTDVSKFVIEFTFNFTDVTKFVIKFTLHFMLGKLIGRHTDDDSGCAYVEMRGGGHRISLSL